MADSTARRPPSSREARGESSPPVLSIVVPCHDEEENIDVLVQRLDEALSPLELPWEVVFVDDGSRDGTLEHLRRLTQMLWVTDRRDQQETRRDPEPARIVWIA
jgi:cellulose synthase/poly-beta-1,6-N-acetylglucosamine synthase-like glycosyltransferase